MDQEIYNETLKALCENREYANYHETFRELDFNNVQLVYGKYLHVQPPIPGLSMDANDYARNQFSMMYNQLYNTKYNIDPYADSYSHSEDQ